MKRFLSLILVLSLALSLIALPAMAEGEEFTITVNLHGLDKSGGTANKIGPKHAEETTGRQDQLLRAGLRFCRRKDQHHAGFRRPA